MKKLTLLLSLLCYASAARAQSQVDTLKNQAYGTFFFMPIEFPIIDNKGFENTLTTAGLPAARYPTASVGFGFQFYANRLIGTLSFVKTTAKKDESTYLTEMEYRSSSFNFGYDLTKSHRYSIYPYLGFKGNGLNYLYREKLEEAASLEDYLHTDLNYKEISNSIAHLDLGFGLSTQWMYLVNARVGYLVPLEKSRWTINNGVNLPHAPGAQYKFYFSLNIGLGGIYSNEEARRRNPQMH
jgi:hypothetical protein